MKTIKGLLLFVVLGLLTTLLLSALKPTPQSIVIGARPPAAIAQPTPTINTQSPAANQESINDSLNTAPGKSKIAIARDGRLGEAVQALNSQIKDVVCARKAYYQKQASEWANQTQSTEETWYLERLDVQTKEIAADQRSYVGLSGATDQHTAAQKYVIDNLALILAIDDLYQGKSGRECVTNLSGSLGAIGEFRNQANAYRAARLKYQADMVRGLNGTSKPDGK